METTRQGVKIGKSGKQKLWSHFDIKKKPHRYILILCMDYGWSKKHPTKAILVADLAELDKWLRGIHRIGQSPVKKPLNDMDGKELQKVIYALENMVIKKHKK